MGFPLQQADTLHAPLVRTIALIAAVWVFSDAGYYFLLPALGQASSYNDNPVGTSLYYLFWVGTTVILFWPQYARWPRLARWRTFGNRLVSLAVWSLAFLAAVTFLAYVLPALPPLSAQALRDDFTLPELPLATSWYFLPKSVEILFQQLLIVAFVLGMAMNRFNLRSISIYGAVLFGATHLLLAFDDVPIGYVVRFSLVAGAFGLIIPYLVLRVPNGFAYSYVVHWGYYAGTVFMARMIGPEAVLKLARSLFGFD
ncbi:hypothetical protein [Nitratireductor sp. ZSWI3]|uniref:hypothetical protein n=1 Tax=Nitratireductor sp. ZSWI3 TaxID=2966359 RepID=UPI00215000CA|nr:hypothetical protein [Nitratireductor sp. ZSWI3]MCR4267457.1 hypothetical protein [Nitratireductor sp. ZSWI3]